jgi:nucleoid-associated protein YgaU
MQRIERYGVIALVFLLVTIMAVALWGQREEQGLLSFMKKGEPAADEVEPPSGKVALPIRGERHASSSLPINARPGETTAAGGEDRVRESLRNSAPTAYTPPSSARGALPLPPESTRAAQRRAAANQVTPPTSGSIAPAVAHTPVRSETSTPAAGTDPKSQRSERSQVVVRKGETLSHIAQRELGSAQRWRDILAVNQGLDPRRMRAGTRLNLPAREASARPQAAAAPVAKAPANRVNGSGSTHSRGYTVQSGDTLSQIALDELGRAIRWKEIVDLNPGLDPDRVLAGTRIVLPAAPRPTAVLAEAVTEPASARRDLARAATTGRRVR